MTASKGHLGPESLYQQGPYDKLFHPGFYNPLWAKEFSGAWDDCQRATWGPSARKTTGDALVSQAHLSNPRKPGWRSWRVLALVPLLCCWARQLQQKQT